MTPFDIAVHGAGFVGQALALALARRGFSVALLGKPKTDAEHTDIRAFALGSAAKTFLADLHAWPNAPHATPVVAMKVYGDTGGAIQFEQSSSADAAALNWIVDVPALAQTLQDMVAQEPRITRLEQSGGVQGDSVEATVHAVCEGKRMDANTVHYHQCAIAARLDCEQPHGHIARQWFNDKGEVLALLPLHGQQVALVWSLTTDEAQRQAQTDPFDFTQALEAACGKVLGTMRLTTERALWPLTLAKPKVWTKDNWVLAGDAAHAVHPLAGQGLNLGLSDAALLAQTLQTLQAGALSFQPTPSQLGRALRRYARARQAAAGTMQWATDSLHLLFARQGAGVQWLRNSGMNTLNRIHFVKNHIIKRAQ